MMEIRNLKFDQPISQPVSWDLWELKKNFCATWQDEDDREHDLEIYRGTFWDGASVPRILTPIMPTRGINDAGTLVHDVFYESQGGKHSVFAYSINGLETDRVLNVLEVNDLFSEFLITSEYPEWRKELACKTVGVFGIPLWYRHNKNIKNKIDKHLKYGGRMEDL
jgi:hypothetical protein